MKLDGNWEEFEKFSDWTFKVDEVSANVYRVIAKHHRGYTTESTGTDPNELLADVMDWITKFGIPGPA